MKSVFLKGLNFLLIGVLAVQVVLGLGMVQVRHANAAEAAESWNAMDTEPLIAPGSAMDLSYLNDMPAGNHGFVKIGEDGNYYFENDSSKKVRFYGPNLVGKLLFPTPDQADALADRLASMGYNVVRLHFQDYMQTWSQGIYKQPTTTLNPPDGEFTIELDERAIGKLDYLIYALKQRGIYVSISIMVGFDMTKIPELAAYGSSYESFKQMYLYLPEAMTVWKAAAKAWLNHVNPYTGLALKDDPVLVGVEPTNETHMVFNPATSGVVTDAFRARVLAELNDFMASKGQPALTAVPNYTSASVPANVKNLLNEYYTNKMLAAYTASRDYLKDLGVKAPVGGMNVHNGALYDLWRTPLDTHETHVYNVLIEKYFTEPTTDGIRTGFQYKPTDFEPLTKAFTTSSTLPYNFYWNYYPGLSLDQTYGKPFVLSEFNHTFPSKGRDELGLFLGGVAAHQGWDMMNQYRFAAINFTEGLENQVLGAGRGMSLTADPLSIMSSYQQALAFRTEYVKEALPRFVIVRDIEWTKTNAASSNVHSGIANFRYVSHQFNTQTVFANKPGEPVAVYKITPDVKREDILSGNLPAANKLSYTTSMSMKQISEMLINTLDDSDPMKARMLAALADNKLLSDTGDLLFDLNLHTYQVQAPNMAGAAGTLNNHPFQLGKVTLSADSATGVISAASLDNQPLEASNRIVMFHTTDVKGTGEEVVPQADGSVKYYLGTLPTLAKQGTGSFTMTTSLDPAGYKAYKLAMNGTRLEEIPVRINGSEISVQLVTDKGFSFELVHDVNAGQDTTAPAAPTGLKAEVAPLASKVYLTWEKSADPESVAVYKIYDGEGKEVGEVNGSLHDYRLNGSAGGMTWHDLSDYTVEGLKSGEKYQFYVRAVDAAGNISSESNRAAVAIPEYLFLDRFEDGIEDGWRNESNGLTWGNYASSAGDSSWTDYAVSAKVGADAWSGKVGLAARMANNTFFYFMAYDSTNHMLSINKRIRGVDTLLASKTVSPLAAGTDHTFQFKVIGTTLQAYVNGQLEATAQDSSISRGYMGLYTNKQTAYFDDVTVTNTKIRTSAAGPDGSIKGGAAFTAALGVENVSQSVYGEVVAQSTRLTYDPNVLEFVSAESIRDGYTIVLQDQNTPGAVRIAAASVTGPIKADADVLRLSWKAKALSGSVETVVNGTTVYADSLGQELTDGGFSFTVRIADKAALFTAIGEAQSVLQSATEGTGIGQYPAGSKAVLQAAIDAALAVYNDPLATDEQVALAVDALNTAKNEFAARIITHAPEDINRDGRISIGDLALAATHYGKSAAASPDWASAAKCDINQDGVIDLLDLVAVAKAIK